MDLEILTHLSLSTVLDKSVFVEIAHSLQYQRCFESRQLSWGVQWEIARLVTDELFKWEDIPLEMLDELKGNNEEAGPKVQGLLLPALNQDPRYARSDARGTSSPRSPWRELDIEQAAIVEGKRRGLGCFSDNDDGWFGGKIQQRIRLALDAKPIQSMDRITDRFVFKMAPLEKGRSNRFARFFGSRRLVQISVHKDIIYKHMDALMMFLTKGLVINGRVFRAFFAKDNNVYLTETAETYERRPNPVEGDHLRLSLLNFIDWFAPLRNNNNQVRSFSIPRA